MTRSLKPCPFCGGSAFMESDARYYKAPQSFPKFYIKCTYCGARTPVVTEEQAVKMWNRRVVNEEDNNRSAR